MENMPTISFVIPTYNSSKVLPLCIKSIIDQDYPRELIEIIIADAGSEDDTLEIAENFGVDKILPNPLVTGEAGKAVGVKEAKNEIIALVDSDNILEGEDWLKKMVEPFKEKDIVGAEPLYYTYRKKDGYITRYSALIGMNDPLCLFLGNYDRYSTLTDRWTEMPVEMEEREGYLKVKLFENALPTIGANGFLVRRSELLKCPIADYLFDIDVVYMLVKSGRDLFAKVDVGIIHLFSGSMSTFVRKQRRRIRDYGYYATMGVREYPWSALTKGKLLKFILYTVTVFPLVGQSIRGWMRKRDGVWAFHVVACWLTLIVYATGVVQNWITRSPDDRKGWH
jgi:glycosyltransferase involved in cell wall biosynthesis